MRTTSGPTSRNEVVPRVTETRVSSPLASVVTGAFGGGAHSVRAQRLGRICARVRDPGGALCRPLSNVAVAVRGGNHGVNDPATRVRSGPAPVRRGRSRHGCHCRFQLSFDGEKRRVLPHRTRSIATQNLPENPARFVPENVACNQVTFGACVPASCRPGNGGSRASHSMSTATIVR